MPNQAPAHWSKDFVEHLRTVHFALIAISAGLILLVLSSKQYNAVTALVEAEEILDLKKQWSLDWIIQHGDYEAYFVPESALATIARFPLIIYLCRNLRILFLLIVELRLELVQCLSAIFRNTTGNTATNSICDCNSIGPQHNSLGR